MPTPNEIISGIVKEGQAQQKNAKYSKNKINILNKKAWLKIFNNFNLGNMDETIKIKDIRNPDSEIVKAILYIYSKETFLPYILNKASREKDQSKVKTIGPYAYVLNEILTASQKYRKDH